LSQSYVEDSTTGPVVTALGRGGKSRLDFRGSDSNGQLTILAGLGTVESPYYGYIFGWFGGTGAAIAASNYINIAIPRGPFNWVRFKSVRVYGTIGAGNAICPMMGISDGATNTDVLPLGGLKVAISAADWMIWDDIDVVVRIDTCTDDALPDSMSNLVSEAGNVAAPCIALYNYGFAGMGSYNFMVHLEWVEL